MPPNAQATAHLPQHKHPSREVGWGVDSWELQLVGRYLQRVLLLLLLISVAGAVALALWLPHRPAFQAVPIMGICTTVGAAWLYRERGLGNAVALLCVGGWLIDVWVCALTGGVASFATVGLAFFIMAAGWMFGVRATALATLASALALLAITWGLDRSELLQSTRLPPSLDALAHAAVYLIGACLVIFFVTGYRKRLHVMRQTMRELEGKTLEVKAARDTLLEVAEVARLHFWSYDCVNNQMRLGQLSPQRWTPSNNTRFSTREQMLARVHPDDRDRVSRAFGQYEVAGGCPEQDIEYRVTSLKTPGEWTWVQVRGAVTERLPNGHARLAMGTSIDITARKLAELQVQEHASRFEQVFRDYPDALVMSRMSEGVVVACNRAAEIMLGRTLDEVIGLNLLTLDSGIDESIFHDLGSRLRRAGSYTDVRALLKDSTGRRFMASLSAFVMQLDGVPHVMTTVRDITAQHEAESARTRSEDMLKAILDATMEGIVVVNSQNQTISTNSRYMEIWHMSPHLVATEHREAAYAWVSDQLAAEDVPAFWARVAALESSESNTRDVIHLRDGRTLERFTQPLMIDGERCRVWSFRDITDLTNISRQLADSNLILEAAFDGIPLPIFHKDAQGRYVRFNRAAVELFGAHRVGQVAVGKTVTEVFNNPRVHIHVEKEKELLATGHLAPYGTRGVTGSGELRDLVYHKSLIKDANGVMTGSIVAVVDVTDHKDIQRRLAASQQRAEELAHALRLMCDNVPDMIWTKDLEGRYQFVNKATADKLLFATSTDEPVGQTDDYFADRERGQHPGDARWYTWGRRSEEYLARVTGDKQLVQSDESGYLRGKYVVLDVRRAPFLSAHGDVVGMVCTARDVTQERVAQEKLRLASLVLENTAEAVVITDENHRILEVNPAFARLAGYTAEDVIGQTPFIIRSARHGKDFYQHIMDTLRDKGEWSGEIWRKRKNGEEYVEWLRVNTIYNPDGSVHRHVSISSDITERKKSEELIWSHAYLDTLTHLPNRRMFQDRLQQALKNVERSRHMVALLFIDLDHFKEVNDTEGHDKGDMLLIEAAKRISTCVRSADTVARLGGDEFTVILTDLHDHAAVERVATKIIHALSQPYSIGDRQAFISASIGITLYPEDGRTVEDLLKCADQAMYEAKNQGRNRYRYFTPSMQAAAQEKQRLVADLRQALKEQQFELYYQPVVNISTGRVEKAEGLIRWTHPERGMVSPGTFIGVAESSGLIREIGDWVFRSVIQQLRTWQDRFGDDFQVSLNVSPIQVRETDCGAIWPELLRQANLGGHHIILEITEGLLVDDSEQVKAQLLAFRDAGIQVAIDDFGTGYSSLSYLNKLDIDVLKIDRSFVRHISFDANELALVEAMVVMAHKLGLKVVAEGVEFEEQLSILRSIGCDYAQGFLYAKPLPVHEFEAWMDGRMSRP